MNLTLVNKMSNISIIQTSVVFVISCFYNFFIIETCHFDMSLFCK